MRSRREEAAEAHPGEMPATTSAALAADNLCKTFVTDDGRRVEAVKNITLSVEHGEFVCVVGPSGHGKSTLLFLFAGLETPTAGTLTASGEPIEGPGADRGLVFQQDTLFLWKRVEDNVGYGLKVRGVNAETRRQRVREYLRLVGLTDQARSWPKELSGGMRKRVAVATVFANDPAVLLMDEPFGALDYVQRRHLQDVLLDLWGSTKRTIVFVTHDVEEALLLCDRILVVVNGELAEDISNPLLRPRNQEMLMSPEVQAIRRRLDELLGVSVSASQRMARQ